VPVALKVTLALEFVGEEELEAGSSTALTEKVGAELPTVTSVFIVVAADTLNKNKCDTTTIIINTKN